MKYRVGAMVLAASFAAIPASAQKMNADDLKWVNQCIEDSKGEPGANSSHCSCLLHLHEREDG